MRKLVMLVVLLFTLTACVSENVYVSAGRAVTEDVRTRVLPRPADEVFNQAKTMFDDLGLELAPGSQGRRLESVWMRHPLGRVGEVTAWLNDPNPLRCLLVICEISRRGGQAARVTWQISADRPTLSGENNEVTDAGRMYYEAFWCILARRLSRVKLAVEFGSDALVGPPCVLHATESAPSLAAGDKLVAADGHALDGLFSLMQILLTKKPGDPLALAVERAGQSTAVTLTLPENDDPNLIPLGGIPVPHHHTLLPDTPPAEPNLHDLPNE